MNRFPIATIATIASALLAAAALSLALPGAAQTAAPGKAAKPGAKPAARAAKAAPKAPPSAPIAPAGDEQKAAASLAYLGDYACEFDQLITVAKDAKNEGYLDVKLKAQQWLMKPVLSSTGALRLEDVKGRMLMIQIANKSMMLDTQAGQRLVDGCMHETQREFVRKMDSGGLIKP